MTTKGGAVKKLTVRIDDSLYRKYKKNLIDEGLTVQEHLKRCIERFVKKQEKAEGGKKNGNR